MLKEKPLPYEISRSLIVEVRKLKCRIGGFQRFMDFKFDEIYEKMNRIIGFVQKTLFSSDRREADDHLVLALRDLGTEMEQRKFEYNESLEQTKRNLHGCDDFCRFDEIESDFASLKEEIRCYIAVCLEGVGLSGMLVEKVFE